MRLRGSAWPFLQRKKEFRRPWHSLTSPAHSLADLPLYDGARVARQLMKRRSPPWQGEGCGEQNLIATAYIVSLPQHVVSSLWTVGRVRTLTQSLSIRHCTNCCNSPWHELDMLVWAAPERCWSMKHEPV